MACAVVELVLETVDVVQVDDATKNELEDDDDEDEEEAAPAPASALPGQTLPRLKNVYGLPSSLVSFPSTTSSYIIHTDRAV